MSIIDERRKALIKHLVSELGKSSVKDFSDSLRLLDVCNLQEEEDIEKVTQDGLIDTLVVLYKFGTLSKLVQIKKEIKGI